MCADLTAQLSHVYLVLGDAGVTCELQFVTLEKSEALATDLPRPPDSEVVTDWKKHICAYFRFRIKTRKKIN